jgi:hypothetical protein
MFDLVSYSDDYKEYYLLECNAVESGRSLPMFQSSIPPSSFLHSWRWRQNVPLKHIWTSTRLHGIIYQKIVDFNTFIVLNCKVQTEFAPVTVANKSKWREFENCLKGNVTRVYTYIIWENIGKYVTFTPRYVASSKNKKKKLSHVFSIYIFIIILEFLYGGQTCCCYVSVQELVQTATIVFGYFRGKTLIHTLYNNSNYTGYRMLNEITIYCITSNIKPPQTKMHPDFKCGFWGKN